MSTGLIFGFLAGGSSIISAKNKIMVSQNQIVKINRLTSIELMFLAEILNEFSRELLACDCSKKNQK